jgi:hypothetical protein
MGTNYLIKTDSNSMEYSPSLQANIDSATHEIPPILWKRKVHQRSIPFIALTVNHTYQHTHIMDLTMTFVLCSYVRLYYCS